VPGVGQLKGPTGTAGSLEVFKMHGQDILIIDDDTDLLELLCHRLRMHGYNVRTAADGSEGYQLAEKEKPDLIILDIRMPVKDGLTTEEDLLKSMGTMLIPVIVMTAFDEPEKKRRAERLGAVAYFKKPLDDSRFMEAVDSILGC
jgi:CheY-like chemotaxis protein